MWLVSNAAFAQAHCLSSSDVQWLSQVDFSSTSEDKNTDFVEVVMRLNDHSSINHI
jgi:hypothetical protein